MAPELGTVVALEITDRGRVALGGLVGSEIGQIEGRLISADTAEYVLQVTGVTFLRGGQQGWRGETVHIRNEYVSSRYERRFSTVRTVTLVALTVGAVALIAGASLAGFNQGDRTEPPMDTIQTIRIPRRP